jgi:hypothetical protein
MKAHPRAIADTVGPAPRADFQAQLEKALIVTYLRARGYTLRSVCDLPSDEGQALLEAASTYAALRLTEIKVRMHSLDAVRGRSS